MAEDIWGPIVQAAHDIRAARKENREEENKKKQLENDRLEKIAKISKEYGEKAAKDELVKMIGEEGSAVFGDNTRLAQAAAKAGISLATFKKDKPKASTSTAYDYSYLGGKNYKNLANSSDPSAEGGEIVDETAAAATGENSALPIDTAPATDRPIPQAPSTGVGGDVAQTIRELPTPDPTDFNFSNAKSISVLKNAQKLITNKETLPNQMLTDGLVGNTAQAGAASKTIQGAENLMRITNREISVREKIDQNYKSAVNDLYKIDPKATSKVIDNFNKTIVPELQQAGVPVDVIDGRKQEFVINYLENLKSSKSEADAILKTQVTEADVFDKNFKETEKLYRFAAVTDKDHLVALIKDPNIKPYEQNVLISALITRMMQDQVEVKTGRNMSVMSPEELDALYTPAMPANSSQSPALDVENISKAGERIRRATPQKKSTTIKPEDKEVPGSGFRPIRR